mmetsp:Transcript_2019/g.4744  ORF Transcript_2019/g.4744 Transcript_2019/m.4744 type:complete len:110 (-) Transcript_2019:207-536(-)
MEPSMPRHPQDFNASIVYAQPSGFMPAPHMPTTKDSFSLQVATSSTAASNNQDDVDGPPYTWGKLASMRAFQIAGVFWAILFLFFWIVVGIAASNAQHCIYINGVCFDR